MAQLSPGVQVNEIDLSIVVPALGNATAAFAGVFTKGPSDKYLLITNVEELIQYYGKPTNSNYNDWFQCYNFLQYANKLLVSRAVDANGTYTDSTNTISAVNEIGKIEIQNAPSLIKVGSIVKFDADMEDEYQVAAIEAPADAVAQVDTLTIANDTYDTITFTVVVNQGLVNEETITITTGAGDDQDAVAAAIALEITNNATSAISATASGNVVTITADTAGVAFTYTVTAGTMTVASVVLADQVGGTYELVFEQVAGQDVDFAGEVAEAVIGASVFVKDFACNALVEVEEDGGTRKLATELHGSRILVQNEEEYEMLELSIPVNAGSRLKFIAKDSGALANGVEIAIAREADFASGTQTAFSGIPLNALFESKPLESKNEIAVIIRVDGKIEETYIVSLVVGAKDYRNKSVYVEDVINKYSNIVYVKDNTASSTMPASCLYTDAVLDSNGVVVTPAENKLLYLANGSDGSVNFGDIEIAYGSVSDNTIFGNKEMIDIDIVIANEAARVAAGTLASDRADCIGFIGAKFEDVVGLASAKIVENLTKDVLTGDLNNGGTANSYNAFFGNYKYQYDKYNDKFRWVSVAGDVAGLRAETNTDLNTWWASAGLDRGQIKNAQKIAFNPNLGQRDMLYKNKVNPIVSFPGQGNAIVWGQKTLQSKPSAFDRINVRGLFNTLERAISRMAKYYLFEFNDAFTRNRFVATIKPFMESVKAGRGCYDYYIRCDETNNTPYIIDTNQFIADIAVKPTRVAEFITLNFIAVGTGVEFSEIFA